MHRCQFSWYKVVRMWILQLSMFQKALVSGGVLHLLGDALGAPVAPKRVVVRVGGYPVERGLRGRGSGRNCLPPLGRRWGADCQVLPPPPFSLCAPLLGRHPRGGLGQLAGCRDAVRRLRPHLGGAGCVPPPPRQVGQSAVVNPPAPPSSLTGEQLCPPGGAGNGGARPADGV